MIKEISTEDIELIRKFEDLSAHGYYVNSQQVTDAYNRILNKNVGNTTCGSCIKHRIAELVMVRNRYELELELNSYEKQAAQSGLTTSQLSDEIKAIEEDVLPKVKKKIKKHNKGE